MHTLDGAAARNQRIVGEDKWTACRAGAGFGGDQQLPIAIAIFFLWRGGTRIGDVLSQQLTIETVDLPRLNPINLAPYSLTIRAKRGPKSQLERQLEAIATLPRNQQQKTLAVVEAMIAHHAER
jgi:hypothetical protein